MNYNQNIVPHCLQKTGTKFEINNITNFNNNLSYIEKYTS